MKLITTLVLLVISQLSFAQVTERITIPKGVVYKYAEAKAIEKAKKLVADNLSDNNDYKILQDMLIVGPELWKRFKDNENILKIEKGNVDFHVDELILKGKMSQNINDSKIIWDEFKKEVSKEYKIRKATPDELKYYWSVISFDIEEPLLIVETEEHNYILNLIKKDLKLMWIDEAPRRNSKNSSGGIVAYQNGEEIKSVSEGIKETKLERVILLNTDDEMKQNTSIEDIKLIVDKTNTLFEDLFRNSLKSGKIMIQFELQKKNNKITFAVKDDLDLELMKQFEKNVNNEEFPNSKKELIKFQLIYKVNSFNDKE